MRILSVILLAGLWIGSGESSEAQHYIGMHKDQIIDSMKVTHKRLRLNTEVINPHYNYLKFEDKINEITVLFFLSDDDICTNIRESYSYSNLSDVIDRLNRDYKSGGKDQWYYMNKGKKYKIVLTEKEWYFTVSIKLDE
ncbi:MAG: hypothetical protein JW801_12285 [Bacteroidales bacterium]|nr:hypothetical protein [Bacteroidales bacterium]